MGVHRDDIVADYMLTNVAGHVEARIAAGARQIRAGYGEAVSDATVRTLMAVRPDYLETAFAAIDDRHGSVRAYLRDVLNVDDARLEAIAERVIA